MAGYDPFKVPKNLGGTFGGPQNPPNPGQWANDRASKVNPTLAQSRPASAFSLFSSTLHNADLSSVSDGIFRLLNVWGEIPDQAMLRVSRLPTQLQAPAAWLVALQRRQATPPDTPSAQQDPLNLTNLILHAAPGQVVLRSSVQDMLRAGSQGIAGSPTHTVVLPAGDHVPPGGKIVSSQGNFMTVELPAVAGVAPNPKDPNYARAIQLSQMLQYVFPHAEVSFEDGSLLGQFMHHINRAENVVTAPVGYAIQNITSAASHVLNDKAVPWANWHDIWAEHHNAQGLVFGKDMARAMGGKPGDPGYGAVVAAGNFLGDWYLNPTIIAGKIAAGVKLAHAVPTIEESLHDVAAGKSLLTRMTYHALSRSPDELVLATKGGRYQMNAGLRIVNANGGLGSGKAAAALAEAWGEKVPATVVRNAVLGASSPSEFKVLIASSFEPVAAHDVSALQAEIKAAQEEIKAQDLAASTAGAVQDPTRVNYLRAKIKFNEAKLAINGNSFVPLRELPRMAVPKRALTALAKVGGDTPAANRLRGYLTSPLETLGVPGTRLNMRAWFTKLGYDHVTNWHVPGKAAEMDHALANARSYMMDMGLNPDQRNTLLGRMIASKNSNELRNIMERDLPGYIQENSRGLQFGDRASRHYSDALSNEMYSTVVDHSTKGTPTIESVLHKVHADGRHEPIPNYLVQTVGGWTLPGHEYVRDITGYFRRAILPHIPNGLKGWHKFQEVEDRITNVWRDFILLGRGPAVAFRTNLEQQARMAGMDIASTFNSSPTWFRYMVKPYGTHPFDPFWQADPSVLGTLAQRWTMEQKGMTRGLIPLLKEELHTNPDNYAAALNARREAMSQLNSDEFARHLLDSTPEDTAKWLLKGRGKHYLDQYRPVLDDPEVMAGKTLPEKVLQLAKDNKASMEALHANDPVMMAAIRHGTVVNSDVAGALGNLRSGMEEAAGLRAAGQTALAAQKEKTLFADFADAAKQWASKHDAVLPSKLKTNREVAKALANGDTEALGSAFDRFVAAHGSYGVRDAEFSDLMSTRLQDGRYAPDPNYQVFGRKDNGGVNFRREGPTIRDKLYQKMLQAPDLKFSRVQLGRQFYDLRYAELKGRGWSNVRANEAAGHWAADQTATLLYDLGSRTSGERFFRHIAPFLPAFNEIMTTWMWKIPMNRGGVGIGHLYLASRLHSLTSLLDDIGFDINHRHQNALFSYLFPQGGSGDKEMVTFNPLSLNLVTGSGGLPTPGFGPIPQAIALALSATSLGKTRGFLDATKTLFPYGLDPQLVPKTISDTYYGITGKAFPLDHLTPDATSTTVQLSMLTATAHAYVELNSEGKHAPDPNAKKWLNDENGFRAANDAYMAAVTDRARSDMRGWYLLHGLMSFVSPTSLALTDSYAQDVQKLYDNLATVAKGSPEADAMYRQWLAQHPYGDLYLEPKTFVRGSVPAPPSAQNQSTSAFFDSISSGKRDIQTPEDYLAIGMAWVSKNRYGDRLDSGLAGLGDAGGILRNWSERTQLVQDYRDEWKRYLHVAPQSVQGYFAHSASLKSSFGTEKLYDAMNSLSGLQGMFTLGGIRDGDYKSTRAQITAALVDAEKAGGSAAKQASDINWWFDNVLDPASATLDNLYAKARDATRNNDQAGKDKAYAQIQAFYNAEKPRTNNGITFPTIQEWQWGAKTAQEKEQASAGWAFDKPQWLTQFQAEKANLPSSKPAITFADYVSTYDQQYYARRDMITGTGSTAKKDALEAQRTRELQAKAMSLGPDAVRMLNLINATPGERLRAAGWFDGVPVFEQLSAYAKSLPPDASSKDVTGVQLDALRQGLVDMANRSYRTNPVFQHHIDPLVNSQTPDANHPIRWDVFWEELLLGVFPFTIQGLPSNTKPVTRGSTGGNLPGAGWTP